MVKNTLRDIFSRKSFLLLSSVWIIVFLMWLNASIGIKGDFKYVINFAFIGYEGMGTFFLAFIYLHGFIWYYVFNILVEYTSNFFVYIILKKNSIKRVISDIILKSFVITSIYYIMLYLLTYIVIKINPFNMLTAVNTNKLFDYNIYFLLIESIINSFIIEMLLFIMYLITKKFELALIFTTSFVIILNVVMGFYENVNEYIFSITYYVTRLKPSVSVIKYVAISIVYLILIIFVICELIKSKSEKIALGEYIRNN